MQIRRREGSEEAVVWLTSPSLTLTSTSTDMLQSGREGGDVFPLRHPHQIVYKVRWHWVNVSREHQELRLPSATSLSGRGRGRSRGHHDEVLDISATQSVVQWTTGHRSQLYWNQIQNESRFPPLGPLLLPSKVELSSRWRRGMNLAAPARADESRVGVCLFSSRCNFRFRARKNKITAAIWPNPPELEGTGRTDGRRKTEDGSRQRSRWRRGLLYFCSLARYPPPPPPPPRNKPKLRNSFKHQRTAAL